MTRTWQAALDLDRRTELHREHVVWNKRASLCQKPKLHIQKPPQTNQSVRICRGKRNETFRRPCDRRPPKPYLHVHFRDTTTTLCFEDDGRCYLPAVPRCGPASHENSSYEAP